MTENASNSFSRKNEKKNARFPKKCGEKNASIIEKGLPITGPEIPVISRIIGPNLVLWHI